MTFAPYLAVLQLAFVALKELHVIEWPWAWVLAPAWLPFVLALALLAVATVYGLLDDEGEP